MADCYVLHRLLMIRIWMTGDVLILSSGLHFMVSTGTYCKSENSLLREGFLLLLLFLFFPYV